jgi:predicted ATPase/DNA-binding SARP family transcriptional activator
MEIRVLGPVELIGAEGPVALPAKQRRLLTALTIECGRVRSDDTLIEAIWEGGPPDSAANLLQVYASQLRKALAPGARIARRGFGYALELDEPEPVDATRFERLLREGREARNDGNPALAASLLRRASSLWRGEAFADFAYEEFVRAEAERLEELRLACIEERLEADIALGRHADALPELQSLLAAHPLRERLLGQTMLALYRAGQQAEALDLYGSFRARLGAELGLEPGPALRELQRRILQQDPTLAAAAAAESSPAGLPSPPNALLGRGRELAELEQMLLRDDVRLLVLTGAGGSGKTRLALEAARRVAASFANGAALVRLASLRDPGLVLDAIAQAVGVRESAGDPLATVAGALRTKELLLVLDNAEHLLQAASTYVDLLSRAPRLTMLVTSRIVLHLSGEHVYPVEPLGEEAAVELFLARAREQDPRLRIDTADERAIRRICERLEGMPLAIELAAGHLRALTPTELHARLEPRLPLLAGGRRDLPERQRTLRATLEWSYALLEAAARRDLRRLSVFEGGWTLDAAERVCGTSVARLTTLVDHNLIRYARTPEGSRYTMLETVREFATERLSADEADDVRTRHADYFLDLGEQAFAGRLEQIGRWLPLVEREHPNLRAALDRLASTDPSAVLRLTGALAPFWTFRGHLIEGRRRLAAALAADGAPTLHRARAQAMFGLLLNTHGDLPQAREQAEQAVALARTLGDEQMLAIALLGLAHVCTNQSEFELALRLDEEALLHARASGDAALAVRPLGGMCYVLVCSRRPDEAESRAHELLEQSRGSFPVEEMFARHYLGDCALLRGEHGRAEDRYREALEHAWRLGYTNQVENELLGVSMCLAGEGHAGEALRLAAAVTASRNVEDVVPAIPWWIEFQERYFAEARAQLGEQAAAFAWEEGSAMGLARAVELALSRPHGAELSRAGDSRG